MLFCSCGSISGALLISLSAGSMRMMMMEDGIGGVSLFIYFFIKILFLFPLGFPCDAYCLEGSMEISLPIYKIFLKRKQRKNSNCLLNDHFVTVVLVMIVACCLS